MAVIPFPEQPVEHPERQHVASQFETSASISSLHPPEEGVFDSGTKFPFFGRVVVGKQLVDWTLVVPENRTYEGLAYFVPGYSGLKQTSRAPRDALAEQGIAAISYTPARRGTSWWEDASNPQKLHAQTIHEIGKDLRTREDITKQVSQSETLELSRYLLVAHSMGGLAAARFAEKHPGLTEIIFNAAACGYGHPTMGELITDLPRGIVNGVRHELAPAIGGGDIAMSLRNVRDMINYYRHVRFLLEGNSCLREDARPRIAEARDNGVLVAYQGYEHDILVRNDPSIAEYVDHHETMLNAGHLAPIRRAQQFALSVSRFVAKQRLTSSL